MPPAQCAYCGTQAVPLQLDHVPPQWMFAEPRPHNLITVPACADCHEPMSKDDEYFRLLIALRGDVVSQPDVAGGVLNAAIRSLSRPQAREYARSFLKTVQEVRLRTPAGLEIGRTGAYWADRERLFREVARIVRGLFFHEVREPLTNDYVVRVFEDTFIDWDRLDKPVLKQFKRTTQVLGSIEQRCIGRAFRYWFLLTSEDPRVSACLLTFYENGVFLALTGPGRAVH